MKNKAGYIWGVISLLLGIQGLAISLFALGKTVLNYSAGVYGLDNSYVEAEVEKVEHLGSVYENAEAEQGYSFYEITFSVENRSDKEHYRGGPYFYYEAEEYRDVHAFSPEREEQESEPLFFQESAPCLPARRRGELKEIVEVRNGVNAIRAVYEPNYDSEKKVLEISLE